MMKCKKNSRHGKKKKKIIVKKRIYKFKQRKIPEPYFESFKECCMIEAYACKDYKPIISNDYKFLNIDKPFQIIPMQLMNTQSNPINCLFDKLLYIEKTCNLVISKYNILLQMMSPTLVNSNADLKEKSLNILIRYKVNKVLNLKA